VSELTRIEIVVALQSSDLFAFCKAEEILRIAGIARERRYPAGARIYQQSDPAEMLYLVVHGEVKLQGADGPPGVIGRLQSFGVREILCGRLHDQDAIATRETLALAIEADDFFDLLANNIDIVKSLFRNLLHDGASPNGSSGDEGPGGPADA
jgi:CRP-like cAMP-binding protein